MSPLLYILEETNNVLMKRKVQPKKNYEITSRAK